MSFFFRSSKSKEPTLAAEQEEKHLQDVQKALMTLLNDDIETADKLLKENDSTYHSLGRGISSFIGSMLGAEKELLKDASDKLLAAENKSWADMKRSQREPTAFRSKIYPPGTEYLICYAIAQLTSAICGVLSGSVSEAIKSFYKLRRAFITLQGIMDVETKYFEQHLNNPNTLVIPNNSITGTPVGRMSLSHENGPNSEKTEGSIPGFGKDSDSDNDFISITGSASQPHLLDIDPLSLGLVNETDIFIHSTLRVCYGILLVVFSMIENPVFNKILYIVGFTGDRERGTRYLWEASRFSSFVSSIAGISLLAYYHGIALCDILPTDPAGEDDLSAYPRARCNELLTRMRTQSSQSKLWRMEEARMLSSARMLQEAVGILADNANSNMKQIATINMFEMALTYMSLHDYEHAAECWIKCSELSSWSPTMYAYQTGVAYVELYRNTRLSDPAVAKRYAQLATEYIRKAPPLSGKQKIMSKELPFDVFIKRKIQKWEERAKSWKVDLVDTIGVSPFTEMVYIWDGDRKKGPEQLEKALETLDWKRCTHPEKFEDDLDEKGLQALFMSSTLRNMGKHAEARKLLEGEILVYNRALFKGHLKDDWTPAAATYELAVLEWVEKDFPNTPPQVQKEKVLNCEKLLLSTQKWESYVLDGRLSMKVLSSKNTVLRHKKIMGW